MQILCILGLILNLANGECIVLITKLESSMTDKDLTDWSANSVQVNDEDDVH